MQMYNPLEQFDIVLYLTLNNINFALNNIVLMTSFNLLILAYLIIMYNQILIHNNINYLILFVIKFIKTLINDSILLKKYSIILLFFYVFIFILISNLLGMIPYSVTITSQLILTLYVSLGFFIGTNIIGLLYHKENYFSLFLPEGIPVFIIPGLILIEYISYFSKIFSLAIRLFANMMSGHILLKILIGFAWSILNSVIGIFLSILPIIIVFAVIGLEFAIAFLQAYVFTILLIIYLNDVLNIH